MSRAESLRYPSSSRASAGAAAYGGEAHGLDWEVVAGSVPELVELSVSGQVMCYRLARHPRTGEPALDRLHRHLYVPASEFWQRRLNRTAGPPAL